MSERHCRRPHRGLWFPTPNAPALNSSSSSQPSPPADGPTKRLDCNCSWRNHCLQIRAKCGSSSYAVSRSCTQRCLYWRQTAWSSNTSTTFEGCDFPLRQAEDRGCRSGILRIAWSTSPCRVQLEGAGSVAEQVHPSRSSSRRSRSPASPESTWL